MADEKKKVSALIPVKLLAALEDKGYTNQTETIIKGLEHLLTEDKEKIKEDIEKIREDEKKIREYRLEAEVHRTRIEELEKHNQTLKADISRLQNVIMEAPDPIELAEVRAHFEGLQKLLDEKDKRVGDLTREIEGLKETNNTLNVFAHYFKSVDFKKIEAPAVEKKSILSRLKFW